jgi:hypothetical protein
MMNRLPAGKTGSLGGHAPYQKMRQKILFGNLPGKSGIIE